MPNTLYDLAQMTHPSTSDVPQNMLAKMARDIELRKQIAMAQAVASGKMPSDIAYGEQGLQAPAIGPISLDPTDYLGPGMLKALGAGALKSFPAMAGVFVNREARTTGFPLNDMASLIRNAQAQIDAENAMRNAPRFTPVNNTARNALVGLGAGGAGLAGGYYGADYLFGNHP